MSITVEKETREMKGKGKKGYKRRWVTRDVRGASQAYGEETATNPYLKKEILEVVENQLRDGDPPETRQTLERLLAAGYSRQQAVEMIGSAVVEEIWVVLHDKKPFDQERFAGLLEKLR